MGAMLMQAAVGAVDGVIAPHRIAVAMLGAIWANNAPPATAVALLQQVATRCRPRQHVIAAVIGQSNRAHCGCVCWVGHHAQGRADGL